MKKIFYAAGFVGLVFIYGFSSFQAADNCDKKTLAANCKKKLEPFQYDSQKFNKIRFTNKAQQIEVEVPVFIGEKYRVVFNTSTLPKPIKISVYTKDKESKKREAVYKSSDAAAGTTEFVFDTPHLRKMFINYEVPADTTGETLTGCAVYMIGFK